MTTYYVDGAVGNDGNAGTSEGAGNAWATIDHAMNTVVGGDTVYVKATGTYSETPAIDTSGSSWAANQCITFEGYTTTVGDEGVVTVSGTTNTLGETGSGNRFYIFKNFTFDGGSAICVNIPASNKVIFYNCTFTNAGTDGIECNDYCAFIKCTLSNNGRYAYITNIGTGEGKFFACKIFGNTSQTLVDYAGVRTMYGCLMYNNNAQLAVGNVLHPTIIHNTFDNEGTTNLAILNTANNQNPTIVNNIFHDTAVAVRLFSTSMINGSGNLFTKVTDKYSTQLTAGGPIINSCGTGDIDDPVPDDPGFTDEAGDDYTLGEGSAAIDIGLTLT